MRRTVTSLVAIGIGAAAYSLNERRQRKKIHPLVRPFLNMKLDRYWNKRTWKQLKKRFN